MKRNLAFNKTILSVIILNVAQVAILIGIMVFQYLRDASVFITFNSETISYITIVLISFLNTFINIKDIQRLGQINSKNDTLVQTLFQLEELNKTLRAQRHDFMNHLQVVYGLIELEEFSDTKDYIEKVYNDIQKVSRVMRTSNPAFNALLQAKVLAGEKRGIETRLTVNSRFDKIKIPTWEFCRVIGNIIDNAIYALENSQGNKYIEIILHEDIKYYYFTIKDNGSGMPQDIIDKIFETGFTTKGNKGEGMGLAITKETLLNYGGSINVRVDNGETIFEGQIPK
ncbi:signal transduction histidine kinase regulating citrate/malate metabolism [Ruminiclostridium papyrosolvens DSM 2782]|uniref:histidine kinase n=1 Tax=Ruminiclostridium papyrosolvens DSM 2782 TaxID=588581 RepID=F1T8K5_9FIRM|nr:ATP-binding protein [Ruminiclostridium papyrosolvens]EGD49803.1 signal transduction histidine kinase regulating citrate/malate metabolism [Ruminiclostridium papyrosolvens DSM 2782]WES33069.1 Spo0B domain-containing protein [Ruminiclostridium papyrosolvens DSM 2782]